MKGSVIAISAIDTGVGKTFATGLLAKALLQQGRKVITQKIVQTGCDGIAEDILEHRRLMGIDVQDVDREGLTCPYVFRFPASPHLAARMEGKAIDLLQIRRATFALQKAYEVVLMEGVGGLLVPLATDLLFADYIASAGYGLLLVTTPRLGSINHTLLSIEACAKRGIALRGIIYNMVGEVNREVDHFIADETRNVIIHYLNKAGYSTPLIELRAGEFDAEALKQLAL